MTRLLLLFSLFAAIAFGLGADPIAFGQDQPTRYSTKHFKRVGFGQDVSRIALEDALKQSRQTTSSTAASADNCAIKKPLPFSRTLSEGHHESGCRGCL